MKQRVSAVIIHDGKILLIHRIKRHEEYYTLPGGTVEPGESLDHAMLREIKEELSIEADIRRLPLEIAGDEREDFYYSVEGYSGTMKIGGPEAERMSPDNQYHLEWITMKQLKEMTNLYPDPKNIKEKLLTLWSV